MDAPSGPITGKVVLLGELGAGKTCLLLRVGRGEWVSDTTPTVGVDFQKVDFPQPSGQLVKLYVWDTAGAERFRSLSTAYMRGANVALLVYDITNRDSFTALAEQWLPLVRGSQCTPDVLTLVVATKVDQPLETHQVSLTEAETWCANEHLTHYRTSAKTGEGVEALFSAVAQTYSQVYVPPEVYDRIACGIRPNPLYEKSACCCSLMAPPPSTFARLAAGLQEFKCAQDPPPRRGFSEIAGSIRRPSLPTRDARCGHGTCLEIGGTEHTLAVDLVSAAKSYLRFLDMIEQQFPELLDEQSEQLARAFPRYAKFLRLVALYPERQLVAAPDVELLWKTHLIRPQHYRQEMEKLFGYVVDHAELPAECEPSRAKASLAETEHLWALHYGPEEPLNAAGQSQQVDDDRLIAARTALPGGRQVPSWEEVAAGLSLTAADVGKDARWLGHFRAFVGKLTTEEAWQDSTLLGQCGTGYARFLTQWTSKNGCPTQTDAAPAEGPTYDVDLMWHAHMVHPVAYWRDCNALGTDLDHVPWPHDTA